jgi:IS5 family transposase
VKAEYPWTEPYRAAIIETDDAKLLNRLHAAKAAIDDRLHELQLDHGGTPEERQAIIDALSGLNVLREELEIRSLDKGGDA